MPVTDPEKIRITKKEKTKRSGQSRSTGRLKLRSSSVAPGATSRMRKP